MSCITANLFGKSLIHLPSFVPANVMYETLMGSVAFGLSDDSSDVDVYGFCIPPKEEVFPHMDGEIIGFDEPKTRFVQFQQAHIVDVTKDGDQRVEYDLAIYSIVRYFHLCMQCSPNIIDSLFTPDDCVLYITPIGSLVRNARHLFLHKGCWAKFKAFADAQIRKMRDSRPVGKRVHIRDQFGYDVKFAYHLVRLIGQCEQILSECDLDLRRNQEHLRAIRRGEIAENEILSWYTEKEKMLESLSESSKLRTLPDREAIKQLLLNCLEQHYGSLKECFPLGISRYD
jgi:predicted nucleotidyltransferase